MKNNYVRLLSVFLLNVLTLFPIMLFFKEKLETSNLFLWGAVVSGGAIISTIVILLFCQIVDKKAFTSMNLRMNKKDLLFSILSILSTVALFLIYLSVAAKLDHFSVEWNTALFSSMQFYLLLIWVGFSWFNAAFTEEVLYRWYLVTNLKHLSIVKIYIGTNVFFMLSHVFKGFDPFYVLFLVITGCSLLYVYFRTGGKLLPVTFAHLAQNLAINHMVGDSDIAILRFDTDPSIFHLMALTILYNALIIGLSKVIYKKSEGLQLKSGTNPLPVITYNQTT